MSIEIEKTPDPVQDLHGADMRQPVASVLALATALTEPGRPVTACGKLGQIVGQAEWLADVIHACRAAHGPPARPGCLAW